MPEFFEPKPAPCMCPCAGISPLTIALESCSNPQKTQQVFASAMKKKMFVLGFPFFVSDVTSEEILDLFSPLHLALGLNR